MKIGVLWRRYRNVDLQKRLTPDNVQDDAYSEAVQHSNAIREQGHAAVLIEWKKDPLETLKKITAEKVDLMFNVSSDKEVAFLETFGIPYAGSGLDLVPLDKAVRKQVVAGSNFLTPEFVIAEGPDRIPEINIDYPLFVKPLRGRGSAGISEENVVYGREQLKDVVGKITGAIGQAALIEQFIPGREITVGIIGYKQPKVLPLLEIGYNNTKTNTYQHKMFDNEILLCPAELPGEVEARIKESALGIYKALNAKDFGRIDMMLSEDNKPYFLELNTYAGLTMVPDEGESYVHNSYMGCMARTAGYARGEFIMEIINSALARYGLPDKRLAAGGM